MATFGPGESNETTFDECRQQCIFVAKYARDGNLVWVKQAGGTSGDSGTGSDITVDSRGNNYVTGSFEGMVTFGPGEPNETTLTSAGSNDIFVAKYSIDGILLWVKQAASTDQDQG